MDSFIQYSGWLFSVLSIALSIVLYRRARAIKRLELHQKAVNSVIFPTNLDAYKVQLNGKDAGGRLTQTHFVLRNRGNTGIEKTDARGPVKIDFELTDGEILGAYVGGGGNADKPPSRLNLLQTGASIILDWDYIDPKDEFQVIAYTSGTFRSAKLRGHFKSGVLVSNTAASSTQAAAGVAVLLGVFVVYPTIAAYISAELFQVMPLRIWSAHWLPPVRIELIVAIAGSLIAMAIGFVAGSCVAAISKWLPMLRRWISKSKTIS